MRFPRTIEHRETYAFLLA